MKIKKINMIKYLKKEREREQRKTEVEYEKKFRKRDRERKKKKEIEYVETKYSSVSSRLRNTQKPSRPSGTCYIVRFKR